MLKSKIADLVSKIQSSRTAYYNNTSTVTDQVYDAWMDELASLDPYHPELAKIGAEPVSNWAKHRHTVSMGSLNKVNNLDQFKTWADKYCDTDFFLTYKLDGLSLSIIYEDGKLSKAVTRGSGETGEIITQNVLHIPHVPLRIPLKGTVHVRGEIMFELAEFEQFKEEYSNPRNAASGISRRYDGEHSDKLRFYAYQLHAEFDEGTEPKTEVEQFEFLKKMGFTIPFYKIFKTAEEVQTFRDTLDRTKLPIELDGLVCRCNNLVKQQSFGMTDNRPKGAIAYKFDNQGAVSTITSIDFQVGSSGIICPVAYFEPVQIEGAFLKKCSLYNFARVKELGVNVGSKVLIVRAGGIIPRLEQVVENIQESVKPPTECPSCGASTVEVGAFLKCSKPKECLKSKKETVLKYIKALNILEWGDKLIDHLFEKKLVNTIGDLYNLTTKDLASLERMGEKSAQNCIDALNDRKTISLERALGAIGIPGISESTFKLIIAAGYDSFDKIVDATEEQLSAIKGMGEVKSRVIANFFDNHYDEAAKILSHLKIGSKTTGLAGYNFCFTGSFKTAKREVLEDLVKSHSGGVKDNVTKDTNFLVTNDTNSGSSKNTKAKQLGITILTEEGFLALVESKS